MEIGNLCKTLIEKKFIERGKNVYIPIDSIGIICDISSDWVFLEIQTDFLPEGVAVISYNKNEIKAIQ